MKPIRVVLVEDHAIVRQGLRALLELDEQVEIVGEAADGEQAIGVVESMSPNVVLMDLTLPRLDGFQAIAAIRRRWPGIHVVVLTMHVDDRLMLRALESGAEGYLTKSATCEQVVRTLYAVVSGQTAFDCTLLERLLGKFPGSGPPDRGKPENDLTPAEARVLAALCRGLPNKAIAAELKLSETTVKAHLRRIFGKLGVTSRTQAVLKASHLGWVDRCRTNEENHAFGRRKSTG